MAVFDSSSDSGAYASPNRPFGAPAKSAGLAGASNASGAPRLAVARPHDLRLVGELVPRSELRQAEAELRLSQERSSGLERELAASERSERSLSRYADRLEQRLTERESVYQDEIARLNRALEERERALRTLSYRLGRAEALAGTPAPEFAGFDAEEPAANEPVHELQPAPRRARQDVPGPGPRARQV
ncbi:MAG: hypothetical protein ACYS26_08825 [Planctomycetota bacterium]|jgi:hypothetical protein